MELYINENYFTFLLLGGLLIVMLAYRDVHLPATRTFLIIILVLFLMSAASSLERWAVFSPDRESIRILASIIHYILQPLVIYLELIIIMPEGSTSDVRKRILLALPLLINTCIYLIAPFSGTLVFCYDEAYCFNRGPLGCSVYIVTFFYLALLLLWSIRFFRGNEKRKSIILFFIAAIALLTGALEGFNLVPGYIDEAFALGVFLYYMYLVTLHESQMRANLANKELKLSQSRIRQLQEQIQPHFIFNSVQIMKSFIRTDQEKAAQCLEDFSDYLQANLAALSSDKLIPFTDELEHIRAYVSLALADDRRQIKMQYDIREQDFLLPALTVEPLVENAFRHGVRGSGIVRLSSCLEGDDFVIRVSDNGKGFDPSDGIRSMSSGIGIENTKQRLACLCSSTLHIASNRNGTIVTICIPQSNNIKEREKQKGETDERTDHR